MYRQTLISKVTQYQILEQTEQFERSSLQEGNNAIGNVKMHWTDIILKKWAYHGYHGYTPTLSKLCQNTGFLSLVFSRIWENTGQRKPVFWRRFCPYKEKYESEKTSDLAYFAQCNIPL